MASAVLGCDWSAAQGGNIDVQAVAAAGVRFVIAKASQGESFRDMTFGRYVDAARLAGLDTGAYHWLSPGGDVKKQVATFVNTIKGRINLPPAVDFEDPNGKGQGFLSKCEAFVKGVEDATGSVCMVYTGKWFWIGNIGIDSAYIASRPNWHAEYPSTKRQGRTKADYEAAVAALPAGGPNIAPPWASRGLGATIWQFDGDRGLVLPQGIDSDFNIFMGTEAEYAAWKANPQPTKVKQVFIPTIVNFQKLLMELGWDIGATGADGIVGPKTLAAIKAFQKAHGLQVDGIVGPKTTAAMAAEWAHLHP